MGVRPFAMATLNNDMLLCAYACLVLADGKKDITSDTIHAVLGAAKATVGPGFPEAFAAIAEKGEIDIAKLIKNASQLGGGGGGGGGGGAAPAVAAAAVEEEEEEEEAAPDMDLFGGGGGADY